VAAGDAVTREIRVAAPPELVFPYFTDAERMRRWAGAGHDLEARPGGVYRVEMAPDHVVRGQFLEVSPPHRVRFSWGWEGDAQIVPPGSSTVEVTLTADGDGTIVRLVHRDLPEEATERHTAGWRHYLGRLSVAGAGGDPGPDPGIP